MSRAEQDLAYVSEVIRDAETASSHPRSIYFLWAAIYFVGFSLYDYSLETAGLFWMIAGPAGGALSYWLGYRWAQKNGVRSRRVGMRHLWHWLGMTIVVFMAVGLLYDGGISPTTLAKIVVLIVAFGLYTAGIYLVRPYLWVGVALGIVYLILLTVESLPWMVVGAATGGAMLVAGLFSNRESP